MSLPRNCHAPPITPPSPSRIPSSTCYLILIALMFSLSAYSALVMSTLQYSVCVKVEFVWFEIIVRLLGRLPGELCTSVMALSMVFSRDS